MIYFSQSRMWTFLDKSLYAPEADALVTHPCHHVYGACSTGAQPIRASSVRFVHMPVHSDFFGPLHHKQQKVN